MERNKRKRNRSLKGRWWSRRPTATRPYLFGNRSRSSSVRSIGKIYFLSNPAWTVQKSRGSVQIDGSRPVHPHEKQNSNGPVLFPAREDMPCSGSGEMSTLSASPAERPASALIAALPAWGSPPREMGDHPHGTRQSRLGRRSLGDAGNFVCVKEMRCSMGNEIMPEQIQRFLRSLFCFCQKARDVCWWLPDAVCLADRQTYRR